MSCANGFDGLWPSKDHPAYVPDPTWRAISEMPSACRRNYAALRPEEAAGLRRQNSHLTEQEWGLLMVDPTPERPRFPGFEALGPR